MRDPVDDFHSVAYGFIMVAFIICAVVFIREKQRRRVVAENACGHQVTVAMTARGRSTPG